MQAAGVLNTFAEFVMALLPFVAVFKLQVDKRKRWQVLGLLSLGLLVSFIGIWRTYFIWKALTTYDLTWWLGPQWVASEIENSMALVCREFLSDITQELTFVLRYALAQSQFGPWQGRLQGGSGNSNLHCQQKPLPVQVSATEARL
jgi:hypothetical protein